jgi:phosphopantothenoylcysteine synthetase/decarboxylase
MATTSKKSSTKTTKTTAAETNGGTTKRAVNDKLEGLTEVKRRNIAKFITKERAKSPATSWPKITEAVEAKYGWALPGSMTGRRLMREYGPDNAEEAIIKQERSATPRKRGAKADPNAEALAGLSRTELKELIAEEGLEVKVLKKNTEDDIRANILAAGWTVEDATEDEEEDDTEDEVDDDEEDDEDEEDETTDEEDEDEDEEEDTPAPVAKKVAVKRAPKPKPAAKAKPAAKRKPAAKPNPSK